MLHVCLILVFFAILITPTLVLWLKTETREPTDLTAALVVELIVIILLMGQVVSLTEEMLK